MPFDRKDVTTAVYVRDTQTGNYIPEGVAYFGLNKTKGKVQTKDDTGFPKQLKHPRGSKSSHEITFDSTGE